MKRLAPLIATGAILTGCGGNTELNFREEAQLLTELGTNSNESYDDAANNIANVAVDGNITYVEVTEDVEHFDPELVFQAYSLYDSFSSSNPARLIPYAVADKDMNVVDIGNIYVEIEQSKKDHVVYSIPTNINPNPFYGHPSVFTDFDNFEQTVSVVRPNNQSPLEGLLVEACQSSVHVQLESNDEQLPVEDIDGFELLAQETICNGIGKALTSKISGLDYQTYIKVYETNSTVPNIGYQQSDGQTDVFVDMPILDEAAYDKLPSINAATLHGLTYGTLYE